MKCNICGQEQCFCFKPKITYDIPQPKPHCCPVCNGSGEVSPSLYNLSTTGTAWVECKSCNGKGYIIC